MITDSKNNLGTPEDFLNNKKMSPALHMELQIREVYKGMLELQLHKNEKYGGSGLEPLGVCFKGGAEAGILARVDDKLARIKQSPEPSKNDWSDLIGYAILYCVKKGWTDFSEFKD
jgi:hypothetical protein